MLLFQHTFLSRLQTWVAGAQLCQVGTTAPILQVGSPSDREASQEAPTHGMSKGSLLFPITCSACLIWWCLLMHLTAQGEQRCPKGYVKQN